MSTPANFVLCLGNEGYSASLEPRKIYRLLDDSEASQHGMLRVVDESGEDYLYPASLFVTITLPEKAEKVLLGTS